ncbi:flagellar hook-length control protein FliK [Variovorax sp. H27-G14]|uniref:flagellar hook-length control protein FliK n=1 Tax=Variovorax sp. H27-G14 TaxID=3111914 RepID=UPI0038FD0C94
MTGLAGLAGLVDALLAARLAPRLDVLGIKGESTIGAPGAAVPVGKVGNDVRLPSNAALDRQIPGALTGGALLAGGGGAPASVATRLSVAARVIGAVLADLQAQPGPVRGTQPLLASTQQPASTAALAGALARTVSDSGLFYEAHLAEFATGARSLAQMAREPQARWAGPLVARPDAVVAAAAALASAQFSVPAPGADTLASAGAPQGETPRAGASATPASAHSNTSAQQGASAQPGSAQVSDPAASAGSTPSVDASRLQAAYGQNDSTPARGTAEGDAPAHRIGDLARQSEGAAASQAVRGGEVIHPQSAPLVHQQLDLLATGTFRWSGNAWPDVPMTWSVQEEHDKAEGREGREGAAPLAESERRWSTTVSLTLPRLGEVDLRLSLAGAAVQAHLSAREANTTARLRGDAGKLAKRLEAAGMQLQQFQVMDKNAVTEAA